MLCPPLPPDRLVRNWIDRHKGAASFALHMIGIPLTIVGALLVPIYLAAMSFPVFLFALALFIGGYLLQLLGHAIEGSEAGEVTFLKRKLGRGPALVAIPPEPGPTAA